MKVRLKMAKAPEYLSKESKDFFNKIVEEYEFQEHHIKTLIMACECLDRIEEARLRIKKDGAYFEDKFHKPKPHPALKTEEQNKVIFARLIRELNLDVESPGGIGRPPGLYK